MVLSDGSLRQHVRADREGEVEVVQDRKSVLAPVLLHQEVLEEKLQAKKNGSGDWFRKNIVQFIVPEIVPEIVQMIVPEIVQINDSENYSDNFPGFSRKLIRLFVTEIVKIIVSDIVPIIVPAGRTAGKSNRYTPKAQRNS